ncbi:MAG: hypothetical protein E7223_01890 [Clostridiales bacterium]|nr:hypothetical protein [Clostridiales bacterium]
MIQKRTDWSRHEGMRRYGFGIQTMRQLKVCRICGAPARAEQNFCKECGCRLPEETLYDTYKKKHKVCTYCDIALRDDAEYCPQCGRKVEDRVKLRVVK